MHRRYFMALVAASALLAAWPACAQDKVPVVGVLVLGRPDPAPFLKALRAELPKAGYVEGQNIRLEIRSAEGQASGLVPAAVELVRRKVDVIVAWQTPTVVAAKQATTDIPIVMAGVANPVEVGLVTSLARPGGNITGVAGMGPELAGKNLELMREMFPAARRAGVLANATDAFTPGMLKQMEATGRAVGLELHVISLRPSDPFDKAFEELRAKAVDAVFIQPSLLRKEAIDLANAHRLPSFSIVRLLAEGGGFVSYAQHLTQQIRSTVMFLDKVLKGAKPAETPVQQPTTFELVINLKTAKALGVSVPPTLLARADEVIE